MGASSSTEAAIKFSSWTSRRQEHSRLAIRRCSTKSTLFSGELNLMPDAQSFVMIDDSATERGPTQLNLVLNWSHELERLTTP